MWAFAFLFFYKRRNDVKTRLFDKKKNASLSNTTWNDCPLIVVSKKIFMVVILLWSYSYSRVCRLQKFKKRTKKEKNNHKK